jgi:protein ImuA
MTLATPLSAPFRPPPSVIAGLRHAIGSIENRHLSADQNAARARLGLPALDTVLGGGLVRRALHEVAARSEPEIAAATAFTLGLAARSAQHRPVLWIAEDMAWRESGAPYGPGLDEAGIAPEQILMVAGGRLPDVLWAMEEALRCRAVGAVIGELRHGHLDGVATRRLALAAAQQWTPALLLRASPAARPLAAATRWIVGATPAVSPAAGLGPSRFAVHLIRNRYGIGGSWVLEWNRDAQCFEGLPADPVPVAEPALDRPPAALRPARPEPRKRSRALG